MTIKVHNLPQNITAQATTKAIKASVQKVALVGSLIKGMMVSEAMLQLQFCRKKIAKDMYQLLKSAVHNAENNHNLDIDNLYVSQVLMGKAFILKRFHPRGRGRSAGIKKPYSRVTIFLTEKVV